ncbi:MAG: aminotransferase class I/II-fold pyridoxal phosphate-dependent enzyme [Acidobacteria bacterium]|nr:aminotransferase class I/II-fold pyridoxal phosphate-dependent enzyme [Acidobacteriota bacterium]
MIDLRSDTVTKPTPAMRHAMATCEVGDDVYQEDPTVNRLEERAAAIVGKEAALFVPTGTMGNTIAMKVHTHHGQEVICDARSHVMNWELAMMAWFTGCMPRTIATTDGILTWDRIRAELKPVGPHWAPTGMIEIENTHNMGGGAVYPLEVIDEICDGAHNAGLRVHMDGARVFNAAASCGAPVSRIVERVDTVMFCLSKGLGAPVGSMVAGTRNDIDQARLYRKRLGGGMRQAGVLAAAGLIALQDMPSRLGEDHANARLLAERLATLPGIAVDPGSVRSNIVIFEVSGTGMTAPEFTARLKEQGVLMGSFGDRHVRAVTHFDVPRDACESALEAVQRITAQ